MRLHRAQQVFDFSLTKDFVGHDDSSSLPDLSVSVNYPLVRRQLFQAARAASMKLVGANPDLRAQAELIAVVEPRAGVDHHRRAIDAGGELPSRCQIPR